MQVTASNQQIRDVLRAQRGGARTWMAPDPSAPLLLAHTGVLLCAAQTITDHGVSSGHLRCVGGQWLQVTVSDTDTTWQFSVRDDGTSAIAGTEGLRELDVLDGIRMTPIQIQTIATLHTHHDAHALKLSAHLRCVRVAFSTAGGIVERLISPGGAAHQPRAN